MAEAGPAGGERMKALAAERLQGYVELYEGVADKMTRAEYHAEDLLDDCFRWWGMCVRDATTAATVAWRTYDGVADQPDGAGTDGR